VELVQMGNRMRQQCDPPDADVHEDWINDFPTDQLLPPGEDQAAIPSAVLRHSLASIPAQLLGHTFTPGHTLLHRDGQWVCDHGCDIDG
jgi:hypothetical protein